MKKGYEKYRGFEPINIPDRTWPNNTITKAPTWCSVDLRDGNQALVDPMNLQEKLEFFTTLVKIGFKEIEVGFPSASETEYEILRTLIEGNYIPDDVTIQVLVQAREHLIRKTFEAIDGAKNVIVHFYNSTSTLQRKVVFKTDMQGVIDIAIDGAKLIYELTEEEKKKIKKMVIERVNGRIPILLGVGGNNTRAIVDTLQNDDFTGVDAILSVVPYYNKPSQEGIYQHYKAIAEATELPIVLYNVPGRTGVNMTAETTLRIARDFNNVIAIKEASGNITQMDDIIKNKPENFNVISGDDGITFPLITLGAVGVISVIGNAFPREFSRMTRLALQGDFANALTIHHKFTELFNLLFVDGNPAGVKSMLNAMGMIENKLRLPLVPTRITTFEAIRKVLNELNIKC